MRLEALDRPLEDDADADGDEDEFAPLDRGVPGPERESVRCESTGSDLKDFRGSLLRICFNIVKFDECCEISDKDLGFS